MAGLWSRLTAGLQKTRTAIGDRLGDLMSVGSEMSAETYDELEEILVAADVGISTTEELLDAVRSKRPASLDALRTTLGEEMKKILSPAHPSSIAEMDPPLVILVVGVNGAGKTTSIGKLAAHYHGRGQRVMLAAGDTFRAAAKEQLKIWADRLGTEFVAHQEGADPAAVAFDAAQAALARKIDVLIVDTAGRLQTKKNLMHELTKIQRVLGRVRPDLPQETYLVLDATTGQNALSQARLFTESVHISGLMLAKLDGTARGGIVLAIQKELGLPIRWLGVGEGSEDLEPFNADAFVEALLTRTKQE